jgi:DNA-binding NarL/FixJ family response regulator
VRSDNGMDIACYKLKFTHFGVLLKFALRVSFHPRFKDWTMKVLRTIVIDDHAGFRKTLKRVLRQYPFIEVVAESESAEAAMRTINRLSPELLTVDIHLPGEDGFEFAGKIREQHPEIKLIFISFNGNPVFQKRAEDMECPYVAKERLMDELPAVLKKMNGAALR